LADDLGGRELGREVSWLEGVWTEYDTGPSRIESALRELLHAQYSRGDAKAPARVLNLIVIADREWRGEIQNRLERVGRYHPSRTILCAVEPGRTEIDAMVTMKAADQQLGELALCHEHVVVDIGPQHLSRLATIVDPLIASDLATLVWSPHGYDEAVDALLGLAQVVLIDSHDSPDTSAAVARARRAAEQAYVVDLAWLRSTPWRERVAASFDPPQWRPELGRITSVTARHRPDSAVSGLLFLGWLASRLGWEPGSLAAQNGSLTGSASAGSRQIALRLEGDPELEAPGLAGVALETESGMSLSLDRGAGGLGARRRTRDGRELAWTVMGASRGEAGILGEGIRQALLRDPTYRPALSAAEGMLR
jgi:glucose-6-phosphate dehydrogenase assembly protein OpcA